jgi:hypothetical protein
MKRRPWIDLANAGVCDAPALPFDTDMCANTQDPFMREPLRRSE